MQMFYLGVAIGWVLGVATVIALGAMLDKNDSDGRPKQ